GGTRLPRGTARHDAHPGRGLDAHRSAGGRGALTPAPAGAAPPPRRSSPGAKAGPAALGTVRPADAGPRERPAEAPLRTAGPGVERGDRAPLGRGAVPWAVSCGTRGRCRRGLTSECTATARSTPVAG